MRLLLSLLLTVSAQALLGLEIKAQSQAASCPSLKINCPTDIVWPGTPTDISLNISDINSPLNLKYTWQLSVGQIISGQGTPKITVDTTGLDLDGKPVTVSVEIDGMPTECAKTVSCDFTVIGCRLPLPAMLFDEYGDPPSAIKFDEYSSVSRINEQAHLTNFAIEFKTHLSAVGYIILYGPHTVAQYLSHAQEFLVGMRGIDPKRLMFINGGLRRKTKVELWIVPIGATPPKPNPNF